MAKKKRKKVTRKKRAVRKTTSRKKKTARKKASRKTASRKKVTRRKRTGKASALSRTDSTQLVQELARRQEKLESEREDLAARLAAVEDELSELSGTASTNRRQRHSGKKTARKAAGTDRRGRPRTGKSLADALHKLLKGKTMGVSEAAAAVKKTGYKTKSPNFRTIVNQALLANPKLFKKVARGQYTSK